MSKPTSYELLKDTYAEIRALRLEMVERFEKVEKRVDVLETFKTKVLTVTGIVSAIVSSTVTWLIKKTS